MAAEPKTGAKPGAADHTDLAALEAAAMRKPGDEPPAAPEVPAKMVRAAVARGHTVIAGNPSREYGPGTLVEVTEAEAAHFLAIGFLTDPGTALLQPSVGPMFGSDAAIIRDPNAR